MIIKIIIISFSLFALSRLILRFRDSAVSAIELINWSLIWLLIIIATILPWTTDIVAKIIGVGRGVDAAIYFAIIILLYGLFRFTIKFENLEHQITKIVRREALSHKDKNQSNSHHEY